MKRLVATTFAALFAIAVIFAGLRAVAETAWQSAPFFRGLVIPTSTVNASISITIGGTFQAIAGLPNILGTQTVRNAVSIQNNNINTDNCWLFIGSGTATEATSIILGPGGSYTRYWPYVPSDAFQATCATTSDTLYVDYQ